MPPEPAPADTTDDHTALRRYVLTSRWFSAGIRMSGSGLPSLWGLTKGERSCRCCELAEAVDEVLQGVTIFITGRAMATFSSNHDEVTGSYL